MKQKSKRFPADTTEGARRRNLSEEQIEELELAGGVEGGMQAGSAGGPGEHGLPGTPEEPSGKPRADKSGKRPGR